MQIVQYVSILLEGFVMILGLMLAAKKKVYGWGFALTFAIYVFYDLSNLLSLGIPKNLLYTLFFVATFSVLWAVWGVYRES
ncbi:MAG: hypothetical protein WC645_06445 [Candidatus Margulisiibacteriota bacterium]